MFEVGVTGQFEAAHSLKGDFGPANRVHGHTYRVEVTVRGPRLQEDGTLCDIGLLKTSLQDALSPLHYRNLDDLDPFRHQNSTAEVVALHLYGAIAPRLTGTAVETMTVRVAESPEASASFTGDFM